MEDTPQSSELGELDSLLSRPLRRGSDTEAHVRPWRGEPGSALAVALPTNVAEVRSIVAWARTRGVRLLPQGAVTGLVGASTPPATGSRPLVVSTEALCTRIDIRADAAVAVVDAGVRLSDLNAAAGTHGLELPIDLAADPAIGAMVATNTGGSRVLRHGDMSTHVLGVQAVLADDAVSVVGDIRGLRKDNTGPDPARLLIGSSGALGIITAVALTLDSVPAERVTAFVGPIGDGAAVDLLVHLRRSLAERLSAFEVMCPRALTAAQSRVAPSTALDAGRDPQVSVLVEASGATGTDEALVDALDQAGVAGIAVQVPPRRAWGLRHSTSAGLRALGEVIGFDLCVPTEQLPAIRAAIRLTVAERWPGLEVADFGHWGDGGIHCNVIVPAGRECDHATSSRIREVVYELVTTRFDGSWSAEHGIGPLNAEQWALSTPEVTKRALAAQRAIADPLGILGHPGLPF